MPVVINSVADLRSWATKTLGREQTPEDTEAVANYVSNLADRPAWGADWSRFLAQLACEQLLDVTQ